MLISQARRLPRQRRPRPSQAAEESPGRPVDRLAVEVGAGGLAAVGDVLATRAVLVLSTDAGARVATPRVRAATSRILLFTPCPISTAPVDDRHAAVVVDVDQGAGLVEEDGGERDAEADRHQGQPLLA